MVNISPFAVHKVCWNYCGHIAWKQLLRAQRQWAWLCSNKTLFTKARERSVWPVGVVFWLLFYIALFLKSLLSSHCMSTIFILLPLNIKSFPFLNITDIIVIMYVHPGFLPWDKFLELWLLGHGICLIFAQLPSRKYSRRECYLLLAPLGIKILFNLCQFDRCFKVLFLFFFLVMIIILRGLHLIFFSFFFFGYFKTKICRFIGVFTCPLCSRL